MRLSHFSLCLLTAAICTQLYAEDTATNDSTTQNTEAKLPTIVMTATRTPKSISKLQELSKPFLLMKLRNRLTQVVKLQMFWRNWFHL
jgi:FAD synthase